MTITKYEIDFINVEDADAILIHFWDDDTHQDYVISIDAGRYKDGDEVIRFVRNYYHKDYIDVAVVTHCDEDHYGGYINMIEKFRKSAKNSLNIKRFWLNDPGDYVKVDQYKYFQKISNLRSVVRSVYDENGDKNLLEIIGDIPTHSALSCGGGFCSAFKGAIEILGPTGMYYRSLIPNLRHNANPYNTSEKEFDDSIIEEGKCISPSLDAAPDDSSTHNASSVIIMFKPDKCHKFIFMGDATRDSVNNMFSADREKMRNATLLKLPHHGSIHNMNSDIINLINPDIAIASAKSASKYFNPILKNALKRKGVKVYSTYANTSMLYSSGISMRDGYSVSVPM